MNKLKLGSLFDGIGGFPLSAQRHGIEPVWASEIEPFPIKVTQHHFPDMEHLGDITQINGAEIESVDIITFGSPCQDLSVAGKRAGLEGQRSGLFMDAVRIIRQMRESTGGQFPRFAVWENVPGAYSSNKGQDFRAVLEEIAEAEIPMPESGKWAEAGMVRIGNCDIAWRTLDAQYWGVPQRRRRIFLVADFGGQCAGEILFESEGLRRNIAENREAGEEIAATTRDGVEAAGGNSIIEPQLYDMTHAEEVMRPVKKGLAPTLNARMGTGGNQVPIVMREVSRTLRAEAGAPKHEADWESLILDKPIAFAQNQRDEVRDLGDKTGALQAEPGMKQQTFVTTKVYGICSDGSNSMKSDNPHSGIYEAETTRTLDQNGGNPACNQGGMAIVQCVEPGALSRGQGERVWDKCPTLRAKMGDNQPCVVLNDQGGSQMDVSEQAKGNGGQSLNYINPVRQGYAVRRLTPIEALRLQGFPDWWLDIEGMSDSAKYRAIGNSVAVPCVDFIMSRIAEVLRTK